MRVHCPLGEGPELAEDSSHCPAWLEELWGFLGEEEEHGSDEECGQAPPSIQFLPHTWGFPTSSAGEESDLSSIPGVGKISWRRDLGKGSFQGLLEAGKETVALGPGRGGEGLLHQGQHSCSAGSSGQKGLRFYFTGRPESALLPCVLDRTG